MVTPIPFFACSHNLKGPRRGLVGPWAHKYPHFAKPGPQIGFLQECLRWWDHWLKGIDTGVMDEPMLRAWIEDPIRPAGYNPEKPGKWVAEKHWPPGRDKPLVLALAPGRLGPASTEKVSISSLQTTGLAAGKWCAYGSWADQPLDQRQEMGGQLIFDTEPLSEDIDVLGAPELRLAAASNKPCAFVAATLCEVFPDGASTRISFGLLNLTHRDGHESPEALVPGELYPVTLRLNDIGHRFGSGNRIRIALSNAYWPIVWPSPESNTLTIDCDGSSLSLPVRTPDQMDHKLPDLGAAESSAPLAQTELEPPGNSWTVHFDAFTGTTELKRINDDGLHMIDSTGFILGLRSEFKYTIDAGDPLSARLDTHYIRRYRREDWSVTIDTRIAMTATRDDFVLNANLDAREGDNIVHQRDWSLRIPRDLV